MGEESIGFREFVVRILLNLVVYGFYYFVFFVYFDGVIFEQSDQSIIGELYEFFIMNDFQKVFVDEVFGGGFQFFIYVYVSQVMDIWKRIKGK